MKKKLIQLIEYYQMEIQSLEQQAKNIVFIQLMKLIEKYPGKEWEWECISSNINLTIEMIEKYPDKPWDWNSISENPNITIEIIEKYPDKEWIGFMFLQIPILQLKSLKNILIKNGIGVCLHIMII